MKTNTLFQVRFRPSVKPPRGFTKSAHYNVTDVDGNEYLIGNTWLPASNFIKIKVEDAPVFQKPVLRKIASLKSDEVIELGEHADLVLKQAYKEGYTWPNGSFNLGFSLPKDACLRVCEDGKIMWDNKVNYKNNNITILPASKFVEVAAEEQPITQAQKDECRKIDDEIFNSPFSNQGELVDRNNQLTGQIETMKRLAKIALSNEDYEHMRVILRAIANGEI